MTTRLSSLVPQSRAPGVAGLALFVGVGLGATFAPGTAAAQPAPVAAPMIEAQGDAPSPVGPDENWLVRNIMCQCGSCRHNLIECSSENCGHAIQDRIEIRRLLDQQKTRDQVIEYFIQKYGGQVALATPIDKGFNRLAWLLPYSLGTIAACGMAYGAWRMTRRRPEHSSASPSGASAGGAGPSQGPEDSDLADKLEDELRNLD
jgi:cytochrome c-type biogenesis protein CcmH/NrfF